MIVEGNGPDLMVKAGKPSIPGPTAVPMIKPTAPQKLFPLEAPSEISSLVELLTMFASFSGEGVGHAIALQGAKFVVRGGLDPFVMNKGAITVL